MVQSFFFGRSSRRGLLLRPNLLTISTASTVVKKSDSMTRLTGYYSLISRKQLLVHAQTCVCIQMVDTNLADKTETWSMLGHRVNLQ